MPITTRYPLDDLMDEVRRFPLERGRRVTFEYVLIRGFNDRQGDPALIARLLHGIPSKVNVIPLNEDPDHLPGLHRPAEDSIDRFAAALSERGLTVTVRWSKRSRCGRGLRPAQRPESFESKVKSHKLKVEGPTIFSASGAFAGGTSGDGRCHDGAATSRVVREPQLSTFNFQL